MANCLVWKFVALALFVATARAAVIMEEATEGEVASWKEKALGYVENNKDQFSALQALSAELTKKMVGSLAGMKTAGKAMGNNWVVYFQKSIEQIEADAKEYIPHFAEFYGAIPAPAFKKMALDILRTMLKQNEDHCGKVDLEYFPLHPGLTAHKDRKRRDAESEKMTLAKFGQAISSFFTAADDGLVEYQTKAIAIACPMIDDWLKATIALVDGMTPEQLKPGA